MRKKSMLTVCAFLLTGLLSACGTQPGTDGAAETTVATESATETQPAELTGAQKTVTGQNTDPQTALGEMEALLGMQDEQTADLLGGGEENWTEDKSFYIGRNYEVEMGGTVYQVHTS